MIGRPSFIAVGAGGLVVVVPGEDVELSEDVGLLDAVVEVVVVVVVVVSEPVKVTVGTVLYLEVVVEELGSWVVVAEVLDVLSAVEDVLLD